MTRRPIALIASDAEARRTLRDYLTSVGFGVDERVALDVATAYLGVVTVANDDEQVESLKAQIRSWLKTTRFLRVVVVTSKPTAFRELQLSHGARLVVLAAPAFGWDVADALRAASQGPLPRGA